MVNQMQQNNPAPRPVKKCEHCGSESGPHYDAHKINHQEQQIDPEVKNICHTCFHKNGGQFMHHAEFVKIKEAKQVQHADAHHQMSVSAAAPLVHQSAATQDQDEEEEEEQEQEQDQEPAQEPKRRGRRPATK